MKLTSRHLMFAALAVGVGLILFAILNINFDLGLDEKTGNDISTYGMLGGFALLIWSRKKRTEEASAERAKKEEDEDAQRAVTAESEDTEDEAETEDGVKN